MSKPVIDVRKLFMLPLDKIRDLRTNLNIKFEDGVILENRYYKDVIIFRYFMDIIKEFDIELVSDLWIENFYVKGYFAAPTYLKLYSKFLTLYAKTKLNLDVDNTHVFKRMFAAMYEAVQRVNRELVRNVIEYAIDVEIDDILEIQFDDDLLEALKESSIAKNQEAIENTYKVLDKVFNTKRYDHNLMTMLYLSGAVSKDQVKQLLGSRGYLTELDSKLFTEPMTNSFALGFKNMYDAAIESRAGAKAQYLSTKAIQDSEYANREIQLITMVVERVIRGSCEHPTYVDFYVRPPEYDNNGKKIYDGDLVNIVGKRYLDEDGKEKIIRGDEEHLIGKFIRLRSAVYCSHRDKKAICSHCLGELSHNVLTRDNLGNLTSTYANGKRTQSLLSAKHLLKSATTTPIKLPDTVLKYFTVKNEKLYIKANILNRKTLKPYLRLKQREAWGLKTAVDLKNIRDINIQKISRISTAELVFVNPKTGEVKDIIELKLKSGNRFTFLSVPFISYIMEVGYETPDEDHYLIDLSKFNPKKHIFMYEKKEFDFAALNKEFKSLIKTRKFKLIDGVYRSEYAPHVLVEQLFKLVNTKLNINIALLEVLVYALTIQDPNEQDYDLGRNSPIKNLGGFKEVINGRSIGASYDWDDLQNKVLNPLLYKKEHKPGTPMDIFFKPNEVLDHEGEQ